MLNKNNKNEYLIFFSPCEFTKGFSKALISDIQRGQLTSVNSDVYDFVKASHKKNIHEIVQEYNTDSEDFVESYINYFLENDFAFIGSFDDTKMFMDIPLHFESPSHITTVVIEHSENNFEQIETILKQIDSVLTPTVQYVSFEEIMTIEQIMHLNKLFSSCTNIAAISFVLKYHDGLEFEKLPQVLKTGEFFELIIHSAPSNFNHENYIIYIDEKISSNSQCGNISEDTFSVNMPHFTESQKFNTCLNRKISIDKKGNVKNCLSMETVYGSIFEDDIKNIIKAKSFQILWHINKDSIEVCKDCEFRLVCTDCRCFIKDPQNIHSQPSKCFYNPYIAKWKGEEGYVSIEDCGSYSKESGFTPNHKKIAEINKQLWES
ncbi:MAG: grasp-with-spasm system SPASM domain peptide maturase [Bacteroidales bacterium]|jgi:SPASM domain peptide maturase of grasp-with-spasm system|nr:grasp-with-spasm system SPASM domain peptide maturase [Bacteroidales bacterium]